MGITISNHVSARIPRSRMLDVVRFVLKKLKTSASVDIHIVSPSEIKALNKTFRNKPKITDVLSFPYDEKDYLGEIIICYDVAKADAQDLNITIREELDVLLVHGLVHLQGYDHVTDKDALKMESIEKKMHSDMKRMLKQYT